MEFLKHKKQPRTKGIAEYSKGSKISFSIKQQLYRENSQMQGAKVIGNINVTNVSQSINGFNSDIILSLEILVRGCNLSLMITTSLPPIVLTACHG